MQILNINNFFSNYGGAEQIAYKIALLLEAHGHNQSYFACDKKPYIFQKLINTSHFAAYSNKRTLNLFKSGETFKSIYNLEAKQKLSHYIEQTVPNIILIHNFLYNLTPAVIDVCGKSRIKTILFLHDVRIFCPGGLLAYKDTYCHAEPCIKGNPTACIVNRCKMNKLMPSLFAALNAIFLKHKNIFDKVTYVICPSQAMYDLALRAGVIKDKLVVINHFLSNDNFSLPQKIRKSETEQDYFLYVGRLDQEKGVHFLLQAMLKLPKSVKLRIVGDGYEKNRLEEFAHLNHLDNVIFCGKLSGEDLWSEYQNCIATVHPFNCFESFGLTILESFLFSKPVIASNLGAIPEIVGDGINGILVEPAQPALLASAINNLNNDRNYARQLGQNGYEEVKQKYSEDIYYLKLMELLEK